MIENNIYIKYCCREKTTNGDVYTFSGQQSLVWWQNQNAKDSSFNKERITYLISQLKKACNPITTSN
jgi:uncharacterized protein YaeQ